MVSVLLLGSGTQGLAMVGGLHRAGCRIVMVADEKNNYGFRSRYIDKKFLVTDDVESPEYRNTVSEIVVNEHIDVIIPMGDATAEMLSRNLPELSQLTNILLPPIEVFMNGYDKNRLMRLCAERGCPHPETLDLAEVDVSNDERVTAFPYPALLKPNQTTGGRGMQRVNSADEVRECYDKLHAQYGDYHLQALIPQGGRQVKVQLLTDRQGRLVASSVIEKKRWYPIEGGSNCCAIAIDDVETVTLCARILQDLSWIGFADFDLIEHPETHQLLVMEINPRVPACIKAPIAAGLNWAEAIVDGSLGREVKHYDYHTGTTLRHLGFECLWFMKSPQRWGTRPNWFKFFGKDIYYQDMSDWSDPLPFLCGTWRNVKNVLTGHGK